MNKAEGRGIQSIDIAGRLLSALVEADGPMMLRDLASVADLAPAQAHAYISSFRRLDLVEQDSSTGRYQLGPLAMSLGLARIASFSPLKLARDAAVSLEQELGLMVGLVVWGVNAPTAVQVQSGRYPLNVNLRPGMALPIIGSAAGRVFAAFGGSTDLLRSIDDEFSSAFGGQKPSGLEREAFDAELDVIRKVGFAVTKSEPVPNIDTIAAPVRGPEGHVYAVLFVVGETQKLDSSVNGFPARTLLSVTDRLSRGEQS